MKLATETTGRRFIRFARHAHHVGVDSAGALIAEKTVAGATHARTRLRLKSTTLTIIRIAHRNGKCDVKIKTVMEK